MVLLSPIFNLPAFTGADGNPLNGAHIYQYEAGSNSVLKETFTSETGLIGNANPIVLNSAGQLPSGIAIWLTAGTAYNLVLTESDGVTVIKNFDNVIGVQAHSSATTSTSLWVDTPTATYLSPTSFLVNQNVSAEYAVGNRVRVTVAGGERYGTVTAVSFSSPNTTVTIANDGAVLNSSVSAAAYSLLPVAGRVVDAGAVSYFDALPYTTVGTLGNKIKEIESEDVTTNTRIDALRKVWATTGAGTYTITPSPAITSYTSDQIFTVQFGSAGGAGSTLNVNGLGAKTIKAYSSTGAKTNIAIFANTVSDIAYDGTDFILLDPPPDPAASAPARGFTVFSTNGTFTVPTGVTYLKVTCVGAGGGSGAGNVGLVGYMGGSGGGGAVAIRGFAVTGGTSYAIAVGAAGTASTGVGINGGAGGSTSFGVSTVLAAGGSGGFAATSSSDGSAGAAGSTGVGDIILAAIPGDVYVPGYPVSWGSPGALYGSGGYGSSSLSGGLAGKAGLCIVEY